VSARGGSPGIGLLAHSDVPFHVSIGFGAALAVALYGWAWWRGAGTSWRLGAWTGGVAVLVVASTPWFESAARRSFTGHMAQHVLVIVVAAPLLVLAAPLRMVGRAVHTPIGPFGRVGRRAGAAWRHAAPVMAPLLFLGVLFATHLTSIYDRAIGDRLIHEIEHAAYLVAALLLWTAVTVTGRAGAAAGRVGGVFGVIAGSALLAMVLMSSGRPLITSYEASLGATEALADQRTAAAIMWVSGMAVTLPLLVIAVWRWASAEERIARRAEALGDGVRHRTPPSTEQHPLG
jgi:putative membrane protein